MHSSPRWYLRMLSTLWYCTLRRWELTRNDLPWPGFWIILREISRWPETACLGMDFESYVLWSLSLTLTTCLGRDFGSCVAWGMLLTRNDVLAVAVVSYVALGFLLAINAVPWHGLFGSYVAWGVSFYQERPALDEILSRMLREAFCWPEAICLDRGIWVSCRVRFLWPETTCLGRGIEFYVAWGFSFSRNDLFWKRCMNRMLREDFSFARNVLLW